MATTTAVVLLGCWRKPAKLVRVLEDKVLQGWLTAKEVLIEN